MKTTYVQDGNRVWHKLDKREQVQGRVVGVTVCGKRLASAGGPPNPKPTQAVCPSCSG